MKKAFTLAEVLITLTIIGVIAALTIPNLMQSYKKHQTEVGVKAAYSILSNALNMAKTEYGSYDDMFTILDSTTDGQQQLTIFTEKFLIPYLKINKSCTNQPFSTACMPLLNETRYLLSSVGSSGSYLFDQAHTYRLALSNGMILFVFKNAGGFGFAFDINGFKGPNKSGTDVFAFSLFKSGTGHCLDTGWDNPWCNKGQTLQIGTANTYEVEIGTSCSGNGGGCSAVIAKNGWKIPDDYPVKKF